MATKDDSRKNNTVINNSEEPYDLICIGFGPASLAIAIALHDRGLNSTSRVLFLERQPRFAWHAGMLLPGSRMQISFIKDLASLRDPRSHFTFLNYLHKNNRLIDFTNLGTFLPLREEYNDYLSWCASHFNDKVIYGRTVTEVDPIHTNGSNSVSLFDVHSVNEDGVARTYTARHVIVAVGGKSSIPPVFPSNDRRVIHSSTYTYTVPTVLSDKEAPYRVAVIGGGQSAAEIYSDLQSRYPNCQTRLIIKGQALKPSDDSPFVNEIFNPEKVDEIYALSPEVRAQSIRSDKATNYGVVRLELLERLYEHIYLQKLRDPNEENWPHNIIPLTEVVGVQNSGPRLKLRLRHVRSGVETLEQFNAVVVATGYIRNIHETILKNTKHMLKKDEAGCEFWSVGRDYKLQYEEGKIAANAGVWLQGCCEGTHGLSDTLLSILAVRGGEVVDSIFGKKENEDGISSIRSPPPISAKPYGHDNGHSNDYINRSTKNHTNGLSPKKGIAYTNGTSKTVDRNGASMKSEAQSTWRNLSRRISGRSKAN
ncbi:L-lysine 6-monooxygenase (NADPH-requiring)-domain-containing protein [Kalaharituber pfeilii]|nr:L-lysine 6-monooxygenase (NADPH-requiring)-domain-containing protein [Kalaharituber pfeilii]